MYHIARKYNVEIGRDRSYVWLWGLCAVPQWHNKTRLLWLKCVKFLYINQNSALHLTGFYYKNKPKKNSMKINFSLFEVFCLINEPMKPFNDRKFLFSPTIHSTNSSIYFIPLTSHTYTYMRSLSTLALFIHSTTSAAEVLSLVLPCRA